MSLMYLPMDPERLKKIDEMCELLNITRQDYANAMFSLGGWAFDRVLVGDIIISLNAQRDTYDELEFELFKRLREASIFLNKVSRKD